MAQKEHPKGTLTFRIDADLRDRLQKFADKHERSVGYIIGKAVEEYIKGAK